MKDINKLVRIYDNGGKTLDRFSALPCRQFHKTEARRTCDGLLWYSIGFDDQPYHSMGYHCESLAGAHLGKRIAFEDLPSDDAKKFVTDFASHIGAKQ